MATKNENLYRIDRPLVVSQLCSKYIYTFGGWAGIGQTSGLKNIYKMDLETYEWSVHDQQLIYPRTGSNFIMFRSRDVSNCLRSREYGTR